MSVQDMVGKSGKASIHVEYINRSKTRKKVNTDNSIKTLDSKPSRNNKGKYKLKCIWSYNTFKKNNKDINISSLLKQLDKHFPLNSRYKEEEILASSLVNKTDDGKYIDRFRKRVMFPIQDIRNKVIAFGGRVLDDSKPKYINSPENIV